jgi:hypothetical protein
VQRSTLVGVLVLIAVAVAVGSRAFRLGGPGGALFAMLVVLVVISMIRGWSRWSRPGAAPWRPAPRDVTPRQERLASPDEGRIASSTRRPIVVVESASQSVDDVEHRLESLDRLRRNGLLTDAEYEAKRAQVIAEV